MIPRLGPTHARAIDAFLNAHCANPPSWAELPQLRRLFSWRFLDGLEHLLNRTLGEHGQGGIATVKAAWIDKVPVARATSLTKGTEIGDAAIFSFDQRIDSHGNIVSVEARAAILQAKIARTPGQIAAPTVPVTGGESTTNQLALLSAWPRFDLHETAISPNEVLKGVTVPSPAPPEPHAWFIAAPGRRPKGSKGWPCWWMAGRPRSAQPCSTTLGGLLVAFLNPSVGGPVVGHDFDPVRSMPSFGRSLPIGPPSDWSDLCNALLWIVPRRAAPPSVFRLPNGQFGPGYPRAYAVPRRAIASATARSSPQLSWWSARMSHRLASRFRMRSPPGADATVRDDDDGGMFVVSVTTTRNFDEPFPG